MNNRLSFVLLALGTTVAAAAANWPSWRGPAANGVSPAENVPTEWSESRNVAWKIEMPGRSGSTPIVWGEHIFLAYADGKQNFLVALDQGGKERWKLELGKDRPPEGRKKYPGSHPSPVTDGAHVWAYFRSGDLACVDFSGKEIWRVNLQDTYGENNLWWDLGTSPVLSQKYVMVATQQEKPAYIVAFEKTTGKEAWKQDRNLGANVESNHSYTTPVVYDQGGREVLIVLGADHVTAHDVKNGREIWRVGGLNPTNDKYWRSIAGPVIVDDFVIAPYARGGSMTAIRMGGEGDVTDSHVAWSVTGPFTDVPTPTGKDGRVYICSVKGEVSCLDVNTGKTIWSERIEKHRAKYWASPVIVEDKLVITRDDGTIFFLEHGDTYKLGRAQLNEQTLATPVFTDGQVLVRTFSHLYCIRPKS